MSGKWCWLRGGGDGGGCPCGGWAIASPTQNTGIKTLNFAEYQQMHNLWCGVDDLLAGALVFLRDNYRARVLAIIQLQGGCVHHTEYRAEHTVDSRGISVGVLILQRDGAVGHICESNRLNSKSLQTEELKAGGEHNIADRFWSGDLKVARVQRIVRNQNKP